MGEDVGCTCPPVLALVPKTGEVVGGAIQEPFVRTPAPAGETRSKRRQRETRETDVWMRLVERLGSFPAETLVVHVGDRGADMFPFFQACQVTHTHFLIRGFENRRLQSQEDAQAHLLDEVRSWPMVAHRTLHVPASHGRTARSTVVQLAFGQLTILPPRFETRCSKEPLSLWAVRGRARKHSSRRGATGMDSVDVGSHCYPGASLGARELV